MTHRHLTDREERLARLSLAASDAKGLSNAWAAYRIALEWARAKAWVRSRRVKLDEPRARAWVDAQRAEREIEAARQDGRA